MNDQIVLYTRDIDFISLKSESGFLKIILKLFQKDYQLLSWIKLYLALFNSTKNNRKKTSICSKIDLNMPYFKVQYGIHTAPTFLYHWNRYHWIIPNATWLFSYIEVTDWNCQKPNFSAKVDAFFKMKISEFWLLSMLLVSL